MSIEGLSVAARVIQSRSAVGWAKPPKAACPRGAESRRSLEPLSHPAIDAQVELVDERLAANRKKAAAA
jgi:hypothetical protein